MAIIPLPEATLSQQENRKTTVDVVAIHGLQEDEYETWTDPQSKVLWLRDLLPKRLHNFRTLLYSYPAKSFISPGVGSTNTTLAHATTLIAELYADRYTSNAVDRPIIFICHGFGGLLLKRALALSSSREGNFVEHLRTIYTCTYGILFLGTPHNGFNENGLFLQGDQEQGPSHFILSLGKGSEMLNEINDQFAPLMKNFSVYNFWEELRTGSGPASSFVVDQDSAAPLAWDNVEKCGIAATHSEMVKFSSLSDRKFQPILEALSRYIREAPMVITSRWRMNAQFMNQKRQQQIQELLLPQRQVSLVDSTIPVVNKWCIIPRRPSTYFTGRQKHASYVKEQFGPVRQCESRCKPKVLVIYGLGGSGKTQFCLKYAEENKDRYWAVFWVDASSQESVESGFASIGTQIGRASTMNSAIYWLSYCEQPWLLILDNADDVDMDTILTWYPSDGNGHVLITTRNPNTTIHATVGNLRFRGMEPEEAVSLLLKEASPNSCQEPQPVDSEKWDLAKGIATELGYLPLAIKHAGTTIRRQIYTLERYLKYYLSQRKITLSSSRSKSVDEINIVATWEIPFRKIATKESVEHRDAVDLMHAFAFMHHEAIPERIFQRSWEDLRSTVKSVTQPPDILQPAWNVEVEARIRRAIMILCDHSIIEFTDGLCTMHPVVHSWARDRLNHEEQTRWLKLTMAILAECISPNFEASGRQFRALLLPHIHSCLQLHKSEQLRKKETLESASQMEKFAWVYAEQGQWKSAREWQERVIEIRKKMLGKRHADTIRAQRNYGHILWNLFDIQSLIRVHEQVLAIQRWNRQHFSDWTVWPVWEPIHVPYCLALNDMTRARWLAGENQKSKMDGERAVEGLRKRFGPEDPQTLNAMFNLARTYLHLHEFEKCRRLLLWVLRLQKRFFGLKHPETLMTRNELGMLLCASRSNSKRHMRFAERMVENVLQARREILGEEHAYTLWSVNDLSKIHRESGYPQKAVSALEGILPVVIRTLGEKHVGFAMTLTNLGKAYLMSGKLKEAEDVVQQILQNMPSNHPDWIHNMNGYANVKFKLGKLEEAEEHCVRVMNKVALKKSLLLDRPEIESTVKLLMRLYRMQGRQDELAALKRRFPHIEFSMEDQDPPDSYAVRRASENSLQSPQRATATAEKSKRTTSSRLEQQGPFTKPMARRTF